MKSAGDRMPGGSAQEVLAQLAGEIGKATSTAGQDNAIQETYKSVLQDPATLRECKQFVLANNHSDVRKHPAFIAWMSKIRTSLCQCSPSQDDWNPSSACEFHDAVHTIPDMCWGVANLMEQENVVPVAVPVVGAACLMLAIAASEKAETNAGELPASQNGEGSQSHDSSKDPHHCVLESSCCPC